MRSFICITPFILAAFILSLILSAPHASAAAKAPERAIVEIDITKPANAAILTDGTIDIIGVRNGKAAVCVTTAKLAAMRTGGFTFRTIMRDADDIFKRFEGVPNAGVYRTYEELAEELNNLSLKHPDIMTVSSIGQSVEGREIFAAKLAVGEKSPAKRADRPQVLIMGAHHAREWISVEVTMYVLNHLLDNYKKDPAITKLIESREIWFVPMVNPDGITYSQTQYKYWRKNRRDNGNGVFGVDLNRNYGYLWGGVGSSNDPEQDTYHGTSAFSEPETAAVRSLVDANKFVSCLTYHSYSELVLYPWGHTYADANDPILSGIGDTIGKLINYTPQQSSDLYPTTGDTTDWLYGAKKCYAFTVELGNEFIPADAEVEKICKRNLPGAMYLLEKSGKLVNPIVHTPRLSPDSPGAHAFSCSINREYYPNLQIKSVELVIAANGSQSRIVFSPDAASSDISGVEVYRALAPASAISGSIEYFIELRDAAGETYRYPEAFNYRYNAVPGKVLLVHDSTDPKDEAIGSFYEKGLARLKLSADTWVPAKYGRMPEELMKRYPLCIWYSGATSKEILSADELALIENYLNSGLSMIVTGQDIAYSFKRDPEPLAKYFKIKFVKDNTLMFNIAGADAATSGLLFSIKGAGGAMNQTVPDEIDPLAGARTIFKYSAQAPAEAGAEAPAGSSKGIVSSGSAGVAVDSYKGRLAVLAFGIEGVVSDAHRNALIEKIALPMILGRTLAATVAAGGERISSSLEYRLSDIFAKDNIPSSSLVAPNLAGVRRTLEARERQKSIREPR